MKKRIISWCLVFAIVLGFFGLTRFLKSEEKILYGQKGGKILATVDDDNDISEYVFGMCGFVVSENNDFVMELDDNANLVIKHKTSGDVWCAVPGDSATNSRYGSLIIDFFEDNVTEQTFYSAEHSVDLSQAKVFRTEKGVKVEYILGELQVEYLYPQMISKVRMEKFFEKMNDDDIEFLERRYSLYELEFFSEEDKKTLIYQYPRLEHEDLYIITDELSKRNKARLTQVFTDAGYTEEDLKLDNQDTEQTAENPLTFKISINYELTDAGFIAYINNDDLQFYNNYPIKNIRLLPSFDALADGDEGYFVIPSGSGALMRAENSLPKAETSLAVFGNNLASVSDYQNSNELCSLPIFGQYKNGRGYLCIITDAEEQASINALRESTCSSVFTTFSYIDNISTSLSSANNVTFFADEASSDRFSVEYILIPDLTEESAYSAMARLYREKLTGQGVLSKKVNGGVPLLAEFTNVINYDDMALGFIPVNREYAMTSYDATLKISEELSTLSGNENLNVLLTGWNKKGVNRQKFGKIEFSSVAGGKDDFDTLIEALNNKNINSYLDLKFTFTETFSSDRFSQTDDAGRNIVNSIVKLNVKDALLNSYAETNFRLIAPQKFSYLWEKYSGSGNVTTNGIGVSELTAVLYANYSNDTYFGREDMINEVKAILSSANESKRVLGNVGNIYSLKYIDFINNLSVSSSGINAYYRDVPLVQMVLHGSVDYVSVAMNSSSDKNKSLLKLIETGSGIHYDITDNQMDDLFDTDYAYLYNTNYSYLKNEIKENFTVLSKALEGLADKQIVEHTYLSDDVVVVKYENDTEIYINYGMKDYESGGLTVKPCDYYRVDK